MRWWLLESWTERRRVEVRRALDMLVRAGLLIVTTDTEHRRHYKLDPGRLGEVRRLLAARDTDPEREPGSEPEAEESRWPIS